MSFENLDAFLHMGGHGLYVWLSYSVGLFIFIVAFITPSLKHKKIVKELQQAQRRLRIKKAPSEKDTHSH